VKWKRKSKFCYGERRRRREGLALETGGAGSRVTYFEGTVISGTKLYA